MTICYCTCTIWQIAGTYENKTLQKFIVRKLLKMKNSRFTVGLMGREPEALAMLMATPMDLVTLTCLTDSNGTC